MLPVSKEEKKNERIGLAISLGIHAAMLLLFFFIFVWQPPDPPHPEYGIELNFGVDEAGSGQTQTTSPASDAESKEDARPDEPAERLIEPTPEPVEQPRDVKEVAKATPPVHTTPAESPHHVEETKPAPAPKKVEEPKRQAETDGARGKEGTGDKAAKNNNGDKPGAVGDQGNPQGSLDAKALYGKPGHGGGSSLDMTGWRWESPPNQKDQSSEEGKIIFEIKVDDTGEIISVRTLEKTVSPSVEKFYKQQVERLSFVKTRDNVTPAPESTGKITIIITSR